MKCIVLFFEVSDMKEEKDNIQKIVDDIKRDEPTKEKDPLNFVVGALLLIVGIFILSRKIVVNSGFFGYTLWGFHMGFGLVVIPLIIGVIWMFYNPKSIWAKILSALGAIFILVSIILNTSIHLISMTLFDYVVITGMIAAGIGLLFRYYFKKK